MSPSLRVVIVSDTHGELDDRIAREAVGSDIVVHAGDIGRREVLDALTPRDGRLIAVRGNNDVRDKWQPSDWAWLESVPWEARLPLPGGELVVVHGHRYGNPGRCHERIRHDYPDARMVVYGHSHRACVDQSALPWVLNPGVAGRVRTFGGPAFCVLRASTTRWHIDARRYADAVKKPGPDTQRRASA
jgi:putative phosphoesterase